MPSFTERYWNLGQVAAWVVYRSRKLVNEFQSPTDHQWGGLTLYPTMHSYEAVASLKELQQGLINGNLLAWGRTQNPAGEFVEVSAVEWTDLTIRPPRVFRSGPGSSQVQTWIDLRFEREAVLRAWPDPHAVIRPSRRSKLDWDAVDRKINALKATDLDISSMSGHGLSKRIRHMMASEYDSHQIPAERTLRQHLAKLRKAGGLTKQT
jgi:hypothetical protein